MTNRRQSNLSCDSSVYAAEQGDRNDCAIRALAVVLDVPYRECHTLFAHYGRRPKCGTLVLTSDRVHRELGMRRVDENYLDWRGPLTVAQFVRQYPRGRFVVHTRTHAFAVIDGVVHDWSTLAPKSRRRIKRAWQA